jgi:TolB protein
MRSTKGSLAKKAISTRASSMSQSGPPDNASSGWRSWIRTGANNRFLTDGRALVLTPRFSPTAQAISYLSYANGAPRVYLFNIDTGQQEVIGDFPGMTFAPRFSPDGNRVVLSRAENGVSNLFVLDLRTRRPTRLTDSQAIDTSPAFRGRQQDRVQLRSRRLAAALMMNADGSEVKRISFGSENTALRCGLRALTRLPLQRSTAAPSLSASCGPTARASAC